LEQLDGYLAESSPTTWLLLTRAWLLAMLERGAEVQEAVQAATAMLPDPKAVGSANGCTPRSLRSPATTRSESRRLRVLCEWLEATQQLSLLSTYLARLGRSLCKLGRYDEAEGCIDRSRALAEQVGGTEPVGEYFVWNQVLARVQAHRGRPAEAERLAQKAGGREREVRHAQRPVPGPL
jgi:tetratricopeptide (TPR) repeat protein